VKPISWPSGTRSARGTYSVLTPARPVEFASPRPPALAASARPTAPDVEPRVQAWLCTRGPTGLADCRLTPASKAAPPLPSRGGEHLPAGQRKPGPQRLDPSRRSLLRLQTDRLGRLRCDRRRARAGHEIQSCRGAAIGLRVVLSRSESEAGGPGSVEKQDCRLRAAPPDRSLAPARAHSPLSAGGAARGRGRHASGWRRCRADLGFGMRSHGRAEHARGPAREPPGRGRSRRRWGRDRWAGTRRAPGRACGFAHVGRPSLHRSAAVLDGGWGA
jgi:hypothetical protein